MQQPAESWTDELSGKLIQKISQWNNTPSYPKKIATVYEIVGLLPPPKMVIDARHTLMHVGSLPKAVKKEISAYHRDIHQSIVVLLLRMLRYEGSFFVPDRGICSMRDFVALAENSLDILKQEFPQADHPTPDEGGQPLASERISFQELLQKPERRKRRKRNLLDRLQTAADFPWRMSAILVGVRVVTVFASVRPGRLVRSSRR